MGNNAFNLSNPDDVLGMHNALSPRDYFVFYDDFTDMSVDATADHSRWNMTLVGASSAITCEDTTDGSQEYTGGIIKLLPDATDSDAATLNTQAEMFQLLAGYPLYFEARILISDVSTTTVAIGLCNTDTSIIAGAPTTQIMFKFNTNATVSFLATNAGGTKTVTCASPLATSLDATWYRLAIHWDGNDRLRGYAAKDSVSGGSDWVMIADLDSDTTANYVPLSLGMGIGIEIENTDSGSGDYMLVDYVYACQKRCLME